MPVSHLRNRQQETHVAIRAMNPIRAARATSKIPDELLQPPLVKTLFLALQGSMAATE